MVILTNYLDLNSTHTYNLNALNVDGSSLGNPGPARFGGLLQDCAGNWIMGFYGHVMHLEILQVELLVILNGLALAWENGFRFVSLRSDSKFALSLISGSTPMYHKYAAILGKIASFINQEWTVKFEHILREGNSCADWLAKLGAKSSSSLERVLHPPQDFAFLLEAYARGVSFVRH
ncbi:Ribonuclease H domain [Sesbania bispinosa]|nr:Ribonuclease H domain [Sesbania bispinosa]